MGVDRLSDGPGPAPEAPQRSSCCSWSQRYHARAGSAKLGIRHDRLCQAHGASQPVHPERAAELHPPGGVSARARIPAADPGHGLRRDDAGTRGSRDSRARDTSGRHRLHDLRGSAGGGAGPAAEVGASRLADRVRRRAPFGRSRGVPAHRGGGLRDRRRREMPLAELLDAVREGREPVGIRGLWYLRDGEVVGAEVRRSRMWRSCRARRTICWT